MVGRAPARWSSHGKVAPRSAEDSATAPEVPKESTHTRARCRSCARVSTAREPDLVRRSVVSDVLAHSRAMVLCLHQSTERNRRVVGVASTPPSSCWDVGAVGRGDHTHRLAARAPGRQGLAPCGNPVARANSMVRVRVARARGTHGSQRSFPTSARSSGAPSARRRWWRQYPSHSPKHCRLVHWRRSVGAGTRCRDCSVITASGRRVSSLGRSGPSGTCP